MTNDFMEEGGGFTVEETLLFMCNKEYGEHFVLTKNREAGIAAIGKILWQLDGASEAMLEQCR